jgi:hypothetical protein
MRLCVSVVNLEPPRPLRLCGGCSEVSQPRLFPRLHFVQKFTLTEGLFFIRIFADLHSFAPPAIPDSSCSVFALARG